MFFIFKFFKTKQEKHPEQGLSFLVFSHYFFLSLSLLSSPSGTTTWSFYLSFQIPSFSLLSFFFLFFFDRIETLFVVAMFFSTASTNNAWWWKNLQSPINCNAPLIINSSMAFSALLRPSSSPSHSQVPLSLNLLRFRFS